MTFKKVLGLIAFACLTIIGLSACTLDKESTWKVKKLFVFTINLATQVKKP